MSNILEGVVYQKNQVQTFDSGFQKQELIIEHGEQYKNYTVVEFLKDKIDLLNSVNVGDSVKISINIGGRLYNDKCYNQITAWRIESESGSKSTPKKESKSFAEEIDDDSSLPF